MITDFSQIMSLFKELDEHLEKNADIFLIGGGALMKYDLRSETKDIDIVVSTKEEFNAVMDALRSMRFGEQVPDKAIYGRMTLSDIMVREEYRVDLFQECVCHKFALSERMKERASLALTLKRSRLFICSLNDIFLFKSMTERDGDLMDCRRMAEGYRLNWNAVLEEAEGQSVGDHGVWITWITERMEKLSEMGVNIPILKKMISLSDKYIAKWEEDVLRNAGISDEENY
jgi:hypothetical protein